jgi:hypothetical protein
MESDHRRRIVDTDRVTTANQIAVREEPGHPPVSNRAALTAILSVLKTGMRWRHLHELPFAKLCVADQIDFSRAAVDSSSIRVVGVGPKTGPNSTDCTQPGSKHHIVADANSASTWLLLDLLECPSASRAAFMESMLGIKNFLCFIEYCGFFPKINEL